MYVPKIHEECDVSVLQQLIKNNPLGTWSTIVNGEIEVNHIPFVIREHCGEFGMLVCHVAKANPIWNSFAQSQNSIVTFQGYQSYISPSWYPSKHKDGKAVPTWNYCVVHAHGIPRLITDKSQLLELLHEITDIHEGAQTLPWSVNDAPAEYIDKLAGAIVGIEIPISRLVGKWKFSQNKSEADRLGVIAGLKSVGLPECDSLANEMTKF